LDRAEEKYSRGRRGAPAKGVGRATGARVRIPLSPFCLKITFEKISKKLLTSKKIYDNISELLFERFKKATKNNLKKLLTNTKHFDII
jgi:serine/threonine protein phosphatase PrpC